MGSGHFCVGLWQNAKKMKNIEEDEKFYMQRKKMKSESENDVLFIGTVAKGKMVMFLHIFTHWVA